MVVHMLTVALAIASWYTVADNRGTQTASGIPFSNTKPTCAHKTAPFGTVYLVTNTTNGKTTTCTVTDRGPYIKGRVIDVSPFGASELGMKLSGLAPVTIQKIPQQVTLKGPVPDPWTGVVDHPLPPAVVEKQPEPKHSKPSQRRAKSATVVRKASSQARSSRHKTKPLDAWQETMRNLRSI